MFMELLWLQQDACGCSYALGTWAHPDNNCWTSGKWKVEVYLNLPLQFFFSRLTLDQSTKVEKCQRKAFAIILQAEYKNYDNALKVLNQERLSDRRIAAAIRFGEKCVSNPRHNDMFPLNLPVRGIARQSSKPYKEYFCRMDRFYSSSIPTIARLLNKKQSEGHQWIVPLM